MNGHAAFAQSRTMSLVEATTNVIVGYFLAVLIQLAVFPLFALEVSVMDNFKLGAIFTAASLARGYGLRRLFDRIRVNRAKE